MTSGESLQSLVSSLQSPSQDPFTVMDKLLKEKWIRAGLDGVGALFLI
jgi:hypothetical protein